MAENIIIRLDVNTTSSERNLIQLKDRIKAMRSELEKTDISTAKFGELNREIRKAVTELNGLTKIPPIMINADTGEAVSSIENINTEIKKLTAEAQTMDIGSDKFKETMLNIKALKDQLKDTREELTELNVGANLGKLGGAMAGLAGVVGLLKDQFMDANAESNEYIENATRTIMTMSALTNITKGANDAFEFFNDTIKKSPILFWGTIIIGVVAALKSLYDAIKTYNDEQERSNKLTQTQIDLNKSLEVSLLREKAVVAEQEKEYNKLYQIKKELLRLEFLDEQKKLAEAYGITTANISTYITKADQMVKLQQDLVRVEKEYNAEPDNQKQLALNREYISIQGKIMLLEKEGVTTKNLQTIKTEYSKLNERYSIREGQLQKEITDLKVKDENDINDIREENHKKELDRISEIKKARSVIEGEYLNTLLEIYQSNLSIAESENDLVKIIENRKAIREIEYKMALDQQEELHDQWLQMAKDLSGDQEFIKMTENIQNLVRKTDEIRGQLLELDSDNIEDRKKLQEEYVLYEKKLYTDWAEWQEYTSKKFVKDDEKQQLESMKRVSDIGIELRKKRIEDALTSEIQLQKDILLLEQQSKQRAIKTEEESLLVLQERYMEFLDEKYENEEDKEIEKNEKLQIITDKHNNIVLDKEKLNYKERLKEFDKYLTDTNGAMDKFREQGMDVSDFDKIKNVSQEYIQNFEDIGETSANTILKISLMVKQEMEKYKNDSSDLGKIIYSDLQNQSVILENLLDQHNDINQKRVNGLTTTIEMEGRLRRIKDENHRKDIQNTLYILQLNEQVANALLNLENIKLERYKGYLGKELEVTKRSLDIRKGIELNNITSLYEQGILSKEQYEQGIEDIEGVRRRRGQEADMERLRYYVDIATELYTGLFDYIEMEQQRIADQKIDQINREATYANEQLEKSLKAGLISQENYDQELKRIEEDRLNREKKIKTDQAKKQKQASFIESVINTAVAVTKALPNPALAIAAGISGAIQSALIQAQPLPVFERGGLIGGRSHKMGGTIIEAEKDEIILNKNVRKDPVLNNVASMMNEITGGKSFRVPIPENKRSRYSREQQTIKVINVATDTKKVNDKIIKIENKAIL